MYGRDQVLAWVLIPASRPAPPAARRQHPVAMLVHLREPHHTPRQKASIHSAIYRRKSFV